MRLSPAFLDVFVILLIFVILCVSPKKSSEDAPPEMAHYLVNITWAEAQNDVDLWGKRIGVKGSECGYTRLEVGNLILRNDWTSATYGTTNGEEDRDRIAHESMTVESSAAGTYHFALQGYRLDRPTRVKATIIATSPYRVVAERELEVEDGGWTTILRFRLTDKGKVTDIETDVDTEFTVREE